ncbi:hypothetical protein COOONC_10456, partial [Cooperia oncophora]
VSNNVDCDIHRAKLFRWEKQRICEKRSVKPCVDRILRDKYFTFIFHFLCEGESTSCSLLVKSITAPLFKKGPTEETARYRPISVHGGIESFRRLLNPRSHEYHPPLAIVFVDYKKTLDSKWVNAVLNALPRSPLCTLVCSNGVFRTNHRPFNFSNIPTEKGVRHGDTIFPKFTALLCTMSHVNRYVENYSTDGIRSSNYCSANDINLISDNTVEMEDMAKELHMIGQKTGSNIVQGGDDGQTVV